LSRACPDNRNRQGGQDNRRNNKRTSYQNKAVHEYDAAGSGYADHRDAQRARDDLLQSTVTYADQGAVGFFPLEQNEVLTTFDEVQRDQMDYSQSLASLANRSPTIQHTPKGASRPVDSVNIRFEPSSVDETRKVSGLKCNHDIWMEPVMFGRKRADAKIDTGAQVNVMSRHHFLDLSFTLGQLPSSNVMLVSFNQTLVCPLGCFQTKVRVRGVELPMIFHVVPTCANILVSYCDAVRASLLDPAPRAVCPEDFEVDTLSVYTKEVVHLTLREGAIPKSFPARKVPLAMEDEVHAVLQQMVEEGVIVEEKEPSDWCSPLLVRRKPNGKLRVCMDPRYLNSFLKCATYALPEVECVFPRFRGAKFLSKMDMTAGFWQVLLDDVSSQMCTFSTPFGRFRYLWLPIGIAPSPELFHCIVGDVLNGIEGAMHFVDDVLVWGK
jgi:hypothetical protein